MNADSDRLEELVAECLAREESDGDAGIDSFLKEHASDASELRRRLDSLRALGVFGGRTNGEPFPEELGDFRLLRRLGSGGMGVVYLAEQRSLGRPVALKLIRPDSLYFPGALDRFRREVETAAKLQHEGIAAVYTVGREKGIPYFAMERVDGCSVGDALKGVAHRRPETLTGRDFAAAIDKAARELGGDAPDAAVGETPEAFRGGWVEACVKLVARAARTLEFVHRQGILHRDLKPSNLMVTRGGRILLVDFGLASAASAHGLTRSGSELGSLPYMAPEQTRGETREITARTDVYALGVSLYEMLTLRLPFTASSADGIRQRIQRGGAVNPRSLNREVPVDTATVVLKAMEVDPRERYASALELAEDLTNALERRPVRARAAPPWIVARRWVERNPAWAAALTLGVLLVAGTPAALLVQKHAALEDLERAFGLVRTERDRAQADYRAAMEAVDKMLTTVGHDKLANEPRTEELRRELLAEALDICNGFLERHRGEPSALHEAARAEARLGRIEQMLGNDERALAAFNGAVVKFEELGDARDAAIQRVHRGRIHRERADFEKAAKDFADATAVLERKVEELPGDKAAAEALSDVKTCQADLALAKGKAPEAIAAAARAVELERASLARNPSNPFVKARLGASLERVAAGHELARETEKAEAAYAEAVDILDGAVDAAPVYALRDIRARVRQAFGIHFLRLRQFEKADVHLTESAVARRALRDEFPKVRTARQDLGAVEANLGALKAQMGNVKDAEASFTRSVAEYEWLAAEAPELPDVRHSLAGALNNLARLRMQQKDFAKAREILTRALELETGVIAVNPENPRYHEFAQNQTYNLTRCSLALGDLDGASEAARKLHRLAEGAPAALAVDDRVVAAGLLTIVYETRKSKGDVKQDECRREVLDILRREAERGTLNAKTLATHSNFAGLRGDAEFDALVKDAAK